MNGPAFYDEMRPHFAPLLADLNAAVGPGILVAGGYGLFLKQNWLLGNPPVPVIVPLNQWLDNTPRVTKDLDLVVSLDFIAGQEPQQKILQTLTIHDFRVSEKNPRWQFVKEVSGAKKIIVELHTPSPAMNHAGLQSDRFRVKRKPSLGNAGVHALLNQEAIGSSIHPFGFELEGMGIQAPNPVTWSIMKLTAADDRWRRSEDPNHSEELRSFSRDQAIKHAQDVCRVVAMVTREESDAIPEVIHAIKAAPEFKKAAVIFGTSFADDEQWVSQTLSESWNREDFVRIRDTLSRWFGEPA